jgi:hypothetical protein
VKAGLFFGFWEGLAILREIMGLRELTDYACPWSLLCGGQGRSWAVNNPRTYPGLDISMNVKGGDNEKNI